MGLLDLLFCRHKTATSVERKKTEGTAPSRTPIKIVTIVPDEPLDSVVAAAPPSKVDSTVLTPVLPKESTQQLLERTGIRNRRHNELNALIAIEGSLLPEKRNKKITELRKAVLDTIENDVNQQEYRKAYFLYQSALYVAQRS
jgi:hypothetical protein